MTRRPISPGDLEGLPGLRRSAAAAMVAKQPATVAEALAIPDVGRKTTKYLLRVGLISDPERAQGGRVPLKSKGPGRKGRHIQSPRSSLR